MPENPDDVPQRCLYSPVQSNLLLGIHTVIDQTYIQNLGIFCLISQYQSFNQYSKICLNNNFPYRYSTCYVVQHLTQHNRT